MNFLNKIVDFIIKHSVLYLVLDSLLLFVTIGFCIDNQENQRFICGFGFTLISILILIGVKFLPDIFWSYEFRLVKKYESDEEFKRHVYKHSLVPFAVGLFAFLWGIVELVFQAITT